MKYEEWRAAIGSGDFSSLLSIAEKGAIVRYFGGEAYILNDNLRREIELSEDQHQWTDTLNAAIMKMPNYDGLVCRSISISESESASFLEHHQPEKIVPYNAFSSAKKFVDGFTYYNPEANVQIFIKSKTGKDISSFNPSENEVLYPTGSEFAVKKSSDKGTNTLFYWRKNHEEDPRTNRTRNSISL